MSEPIPIHALVLDQLKAEELYRRPMEKIAGRLIDVLSRRPDYQGYMSTEFALSRFLVPYLAQDGWALFMDCDMLVRKDIGKVFELCDDSKAVMCVKHDYMPSHREKMDGQVQTPYGRKNWSSFMLFNCDHPSNANLGLDLINSVPGRDLHAFCWLKDDEIGELPPEWNFLIGEQEEQKDPAIAHFTLGTPDLARYAKQPFAEEWRSYAHNG
jgi:lipopolysaccharide biosynthesis glycosyltransferase